MNFYDKRIGTPFLLLVDIYKILASFETKWYSRAYHINSFLNILRSLPKHNLIIGMFDSELGEVGNDSDRSYDIKTNSSINQRRSEINIKMLGKQNT